MGAQPKVAYIGIGSNLGDRIVYLSNAVKAIKQLGDSIAMSSVYESDPFGVDDETQPPYLNMVISIDTALTPQNLLRELLDIELGNGRVRRCRNESRTLDLDILMFGSEIIETAELTIPHPRMHERAFVMLPVAEIEPTLNHPTLKLSMSQIADGLLDQGAHRIGSIDELTVQTVVKSPATKPV